MNPSNREYFETIQRLMAEGKPFASVTLTASRGHAPQDEGAKILVSGAGLIQGTVGGGKIEAKAIQHAQQMLATPAAQAQELLTWNLQRDVGMSCGGEVTLFFEVFFCKLWEIAVFGAGHVSQALIRLLIGLDCEIRCIDPRAEWLERLPDSPRLRRIRSDEMPTQVESLSPESFVMLMTQGHKFDLPILVAALKRRRFPYIGVIGSDVKGRLIRKELAEAGISPERIQDLRCPMGLPFGNNSPQEIAISMTAEILQVRDQGLRPASDPAGS